LAFLRLHKTFIIDRGRPYTDTPIVIPPGVLKSSQPIEDNPNLRMALNLTYFLSAIHMCIFIYLFNIYIYTLQYTYVLWPSPDSDGWIWFIILCLGWLHYKISLKLMLLNSFHGYIIDYTIDCTIDDIISHRLTMITHEFSPSQDVMLIPWSPSMALADLAAVWMPRSWSTPRCCWWCPTPRRHRDMAKPAVGDLIVSRGKHGKSPRKLRSEDHFPIFKGLFFGFFLCFLISSFQILILGTSVGFQMGTLRCMEKVLETHFFATQTSPRIPKKAWLVFFGSDMGVLHREVDGILSNLLVFHFHNFRSIKRLAPKKWIVIIDSYYIMLIISATIGTLFLTRKNRRNF